MATFYDIVALDPFVEALSVLDIRHLKYLAEASSECRRAAWATVPFRGEVARLPRADPSVLRRFKELSPALSEVRVAKRPVDTDSLMEELAEAAEDVGVELRIEDRRMKRCIVKRVDRSLQVHGHPSPFL
jgi:hypothetical protein